MPQINGRALVYAHKLLKGKVEGVGVDAIWRERPAQLALALNQMLNVKLVFCIILNQFDTNKKKGEGRCYLARTRAGRGSFATCYYQVRKRGITRSITSSSAMFCCQCRRIMKNFCILKINVKFSLSVHQQSVSRNEIWWLTWSPLRNSYCKCREETFSGNRCTS